MPPKKMTISGSDRMTDSLERLPHMLWSKTRKPCNSQRKNAAQPAKTTALMQNTLPLAGGEPMAEVVGAASMLDVELLATCLIFVHGKRVATPNEQSSATGERRLEPKEDK